MRFFEVVSKAIALVEAEAVLSGAEVTLIRNLYGRIRVARHDIYRVGFGLGRHEGSGRSALSGAADGVAHMGDKDEVTENQQREAWRAKSRGYVAQNIETGREIDQWSRILQALRSERGAGCSSIHYEAFAEGKHASEVRERLVECIKQVLH
jgi:hypothetical protein